MVDLPKDLKGLTSQKVVSQRQKYGANIIPRKKQVSKLVVFLRQLKNPFVFILLIAALVALFLGENLDFSVIIFIIVLNSILGFVQEIRAQNALEALQKIIHPRVVVIRNGDEEVVGPEDLVRGDLVKLRVGDRVPADAVLLSSSSLRLNESILTGESRDIEKKHLGDLKERQSVSLEDFDKSHIVYMGTTVVSGYGVALIVQLGMETEFGKIAETLSESVETKTPLQERLEAFAKQIAFVVLFLSALIAFWAYFFNEQLDFSHHTGQAPEGYEKIFDSLTLAVSLAVSAIPEGMAISLTVILAISMQRLLKRKALVRKMIVAETLGSVTTICVDKTGTLTTGKMKVVDSDLVDKRQVLLTLQAVNKGLNAVDQALSKWFEEESKTTSIGTANGNTPEIFDIPFSSVRKYALSANKKGLFMVGAPEILLERSKMSAEEIKSWTEKIQLNAQKGKRLIGVAQKEVEIGEKYRSMTIEEKDNELVKGLVFLGFLAIEDPVRKDVAKAFDVLETAGIKVKVITGDRRETATEIMRQAGLDAKESEIMSGEDLGKLDKEQLKKQLPDIRLFFRTTPDQKLLIVETLQELGEVVGMMGDGINDAPALKRANVGIAVDNATEVSKETADIVLLETKMSTIVAAVEEGRMIFENLRKLITYLLSDATAEIMLILGSLAFGLPLPLLPLQILYVNLVADGLPDIALGFEPTNSSVMKDKPRKNNKQLIDKEMGLLIFVIGFVVNIFIFFVYVWMYRQGYELDYIRSFVFALLAVDSLLYVYPIRSLRENIWDEDLFANKVLNISVLIGFATVIGAFYIESVKNALRLVPLGLSEVVVILVIATIEILLIEGIKYLFVKHLLPK